MQASPQLTFNGNCREAFEFYARCLGGKVTFMLTWGDSPMAGQMPPSMHDKICHATFLLGGSSFSGGDSSAGDSQFQKPQGFSLALNPDSVAEADRIFASMAEGGEVQMPLQETFWAPRFGMVVDRFGIPWLINCEKPV